LHGSSASRSRRAKPPDAHRCDNAARTGSAEQRGVGAENGSILRRALQQSGTRRHASGHEIYKAGQIHYRRPWERETQPGRLSLSRSTTSHEAFCSLGGTRSMIGSLADGSLATRSTGGFTGSDWRPWVHAERGLLHAERSNERSSSVAGRHVGQNDGAAPAHTRGSA